MTLRCEGCIGAALLRRSSRSRRRPVSEFMADSVSAPAGSEIPVDGSGEARSARRPLGPRRRQHRRRLWRYRHQPALRLARSDHRRVGPGHAESTAPTVLGVLSLILWALFVIVTLKYVLILLRADNNGEGGTLTLMALASRAVGRISRAAGVVALLGIISARAVLRRRRDHAGAVGAVGDRRHRRRDARRSTITWCR